MKEYNIYLSIDDKRILEGLLLRNKLELYELYEIIKNAKTILVKGEKWRKWNIFIKELQTKKR